MTTPSVVSSKPSDKYRGIRAALLTASLPTAIFVLYLLVRLEIHEMVPALLCAVLGVILPISVAAILAPSNKTS